jgi:hypothetical protein
MKTEMAMQIAYFATFDNRKNPASRISESDKSSFIEIVRAIPKLVRAVIFTPDVSYQMQAVDDMPPQLIAVLYFARLDDLEAALAPDGPLQAIAATKRFPSLTDAFATQQAMLSRTFPVPDPVMRSVASEQPWSYVVTYEGEAEDLNHWLGNYLTNHKTVVARLPGVRELEICTRIDWSGSLPWPRATCMLRSNVRFDNAAALKAALNSPARLDVRDDFKKFPPYAGGSRHYPMATQTLQRG